MKRSRGGIYLARVGAALALLGTAVGLVAVLAPHSAIGQVINPLITQAAGTNVVTNTRTMNFVDCSVAVGTASTTANVTCAGIAPGGAAGGDLAGTYPNPTVKKYTATGASTCSGTASFDNSGCSGVGKTTTGAQTIGPGTIAVSGPVTSNIGGTTSVPWTTTGVASVDGYDYTGTAPASVAGVSGTNAGTALSITGAAGGATSNVAGIGGNGEGVVVTTGTGGAGTAGAGSGGAGGSVLVTLGPGGAKTGGGAVGANGTLTARAGAASFGNVIQVQSSTPTTVAAITDTGTVKTPLVDALSAGALTLGTTTATSIALQQNVTMPTTKTLVVGANTLIGSVADKLNAAMLAIASQAIGDVLQADSTTTFARLAGVAAGSYLRSGGVGTANVWSTLKLPNTVVQGDALYATAANVVGVVSACAANNVLVGAGAGLVPVCTAIPLLSASNVWTGTTNTFVHIAGSGTKPTIVAGAAAGTGPTVSIVNGSTDMAGQIAVTTGSGTVNNAIIATITFNTAFAAAPISIVITPANGTTTSASQAFIDPSQTTTTVFVLQCNNLTSLQSTTAYAWFYQVVQ